MPRGKKNRSTDSVSDPSEGELDSDDSMRASRPPKKKAAKKEPVKSKPAPRRVSPKKKQKDMDEEEAPLVDEDEDCEQRGLIEDYDEEDLLNIEVPEAVQPCMASNGGDRLMITDIHVENFKSYYGKRRIGPFHHSFTSIIGPNGSGKSNVIDALLFVFGYKASKIRSKKVSVLIHSSAGHDDIQSCTVRICFQKIIDIPAKDPRKEPSTYKVVPDSAFNVSRTAYKNNNSEYKMNGQRTTFKEVATKLKQVGIDLIHNRFLILQGEVEQIAMMKPRSTGTEDGMLEYLEDIIGSSRYKLPIDKLSGKLDKLQMEKSHQSTKVNKAIEDKEALDEPVQNTLTHMSLQNESAALKCKQFLYNKYKTEDEIEELKPQRAKMEEELDKASSDLRQMAHKLKDKRKAQDAMTKDLSGLQASIHKTTNELECLMQKDKKRENDMNRLQTEMKKLQAEIKKEKEKLEEVMRAPIEAKAKIAQLEIQLTEYREEMITAQELFDENYPKYNKKTTVERAKKAKLEEEYSSYAQRLAEAESKCKLAESSLHSMLEEYEKKKGHLKELEKSLKANEEKLEKDKQTKKEVAEFCAEKAKQRNEARSEMERIDERTEQIKKRLIELIPMFSDKNQEANARRENNVITAAFERAQRNGRMKGYIGRVGDLGSISPEYDRAVSNNFAAPLDLYLVESYQTTKEGLAILKELDKYGRFLQLDKLQYSWPAIEKLLREKEGRTPRIFKQINCERRFLPAFYHAVGDSYVVKTLDDATAFHREMRDKGSRASVITLDGSMIDKRGNYIGGGKNKHMIWVLDKGDVGKMGTSTKQIRRQSSLRDDEEEARRAGEAKREKDELDEEIRQLSSRRRNLEHELNSCAQPLASKEKFSSELDRQIKMAEERIRVQEQQRAERVKEMDTAKVDDTELSRKRAEIDQLAQDRDTVSEESRAFKEKIKQIDADMLKVFNKTVKPHQDCLESAKEQIAAAEKELGRQRAIINSADRNIAKQQTRVAEVDTDVDQKRVKSNNLKDQEEMFSKTKIEKAGALKEMNAQRDMLEEKLSALRISTADMDGEEAAMEKHQKVIQEMLRGNRERLVALEHEVAECEKQVEKLELVNIAAVLEGIPEDMLTTADGRHLMNNRESESEEGEEEVSARRSSPVKRRKSKERMRRRKVSESSPHAKKRRSSSKQRKEAAHAEDERGEAEGMNEREEEQANEADGEEEEQGADVEMAEDETAGGVAAAAAGEEAAAVEEEEEEETEEERELRRARRLQRKRDIRQKREDDLQNGIMPHWSRKHIQNANQDAIDIALDSINKRMGMLKKLLQPHVIEDYKKRVQRLRVEGSLLTVVTEKYNAHNDKLAEIKKLRLADFIAGFNSISTALRELYQMITLGGDASLELKDFIDPFIEGVQFMVRPPKKSWKQIENLSGGEKTLSSLALVFALHKYRPTPLYVMDEIDAALDFRNVSIIGQYLKQKTKNAQFIIISLRNNMFELADRLIGIYKVQDCTRNVVVDPKLVLEQTHDQRMGMAKLSVAMLQARNTTGVGFMGI